MEANTVPRGADRKRVRTTAGPTEDGIRSNPKRRVLAPVEEVPRARTLANERNEVAERTGAQWTAPAPVAVVDRFPAQAASASGTPRSGRPRTPRGWVTNIARGNAYDVYVGRDVWRNGRLVLRDAGWGNPFVIGRDGTRDQVIARYERELLADPVRLARARAELKGKVLGCWCAPLPCHADALARIANNNDVE